MIEAGRATRIEHRVAGLDSNPYLMLAVILAAALRGLEAQSVPPEPLTGEHSESGCESLPSTWKKPGPFRAIGFHRRGAGYALPRAIRRLQAAGDRGNRAHVTEVEYDAYLRSA